MILELESFVLQTVICYLSFTTLSWIYTNGRRSLMRRIDLTVSLIHIIMKALYSVISSNSSVWKYFWFAGSTVRCVSIRMVNIWCRTNSIHSCRWILWRPDRLFDPSGFYLLQALNISMDIEPEHVIVEHSMAMYIPPNERLINRRMSEIVLLLLKTVRFRNGRQRREQILVDSSKLN